MAHSRLPVGTLSGKSNCVPRLVPYFLLPCTMIPLFYFIGLAIGFWWGWGSCRAFKSWHIEIPFMVNKENWKVIATWQGELSNQHVSFHKESNS